MPVTLYRVMIDTCIWLDLARNYRAAPLVRALYDMCDNAELEIIVPDIVKEEFERNKDRVLAEATKSVQSTLKTLKSALPTFLDPVAQKDALDAIQGLDFTSATGGMPSILDQVEELMGHPENIEIESTIFQKARAANRALDKHAPCHQGKNSVADAVLFEIYDELRNEPHRDHIAYVFATTNHKDFSELKGDNRAPHPDLKFAFNDRSLYVVDLGKFVEKHVPDLHTYFDMEQGLFPSFRSLSDLPQAVVRPLGHEGRRGAGRARAPRPARGFRRARRPRPWAHRTHRPHARREAGSDSRPRSAAGSRDARRRRPVGWAIYRSCCDC